ncbi:helix-turn-helix transcriptional regulator [Listeria fleischmannii]|uniref:HTH domain-containing protein n=1 Tax=Listeria fleischmannii FSL S10-1203 TaxID=1265822 RepID=W7D2L8_9LIST|nr:helix-turn-helix domain-containing protein [Listeria fleischmannii]EUJ46194.1 HTH domain-containing protein [Listeria fleischmannii FSL S10-1203]
MRKALISLRKKTSRQVVANDLGISRQMLGAIERGDRTPSLDLANRIAKYYGVPIEDIFFNDIDTKRVCSTHKQPT